MKFSALVATVALLSVGCAGQMEEASDFEADDGESTAALTAGTLISLRKNASNPQWDFLTVNAANGTTTVVGSIPYTTLYSDDLSTSTVDARALRLYVFGKEPSSNNWRLFSINTTNAAVVSEPVVQRVVDIEVNTSGQLVGLCVQGTTKQFCRVAPSSGVITVLNANLGNDLGDVRWSSALDRTTNRYFTIIGDRLLTLDAATGQLLSNVVAELPLESLRASVTGQLVGIDGVGSSFAPASLNSVTGVVLLVGWITAYIANPTGYQPTHTAIDRAASRLYYIDYDFGTRLYKYNSSNLSGAGFVNLQGAVTDWHHLHVL